MSFLSKRGKVSCVVESGGSLPCKLQHGYEVPPKNCIPSGRTSCTWAFGIFISSICRWQQQGDSRDVEHDHESPCAKALTLCLTPRRWKLFGGHKGDSIRCEMFPVSLSFFLLHKQLLLHPWLRVIVVPSPKVKKPVIRLLVWPNFPQTARTIRSSAFRGLTTCSFGGEQTKRCQFTEISRRTP